MVIVILEMSEEDVRERINARHNGNKTMADMLMVTASDLKLELMSDFVSRKLARYFSQQRRARRTLSLSPFARECLNWTSWRRFCLKLHVNM